MFYQQSLFTYLELEYLCILIHHCLTPQTDGAFVHFLIPIFPSFNANKEGKKKKKNQTRRNWTLGIPTSLYIPTEKEGAQSMSYMQFNLKTNKSHTQLHPQILVIHHPPHGLWHFCSLRAIQCWHALHFQSPNTITFTITSNQSFHQTPFLYNNKKDTKETSTGRRNNTTTTLVFRSSNPSDPSSKMVSNFGQFEDLTGHINRDGATSTQFSTHLILSCFAISASLIFKTHLQRNNGVGIEKMVI